MSGRGGEPVRRIKCLVWDLDGVVWDGTLLEGDDLRPRAEVIKGIVELDSRGILHSIASRNDPEQAMSKLGELGLREYFLAPQIGFGPKSASLARIMEAMQLAPEAVAFIDDQPFELEEVRSVHPGVLCVPVGEMPAFLGSDALMPRFITEDARMRRRTMLQDLRRKEEEDSHQGPAEEFLASLGMEFSIHRATEDDLQRAEELTIRTSQMNTTGRHYSYESLRDVIRSPHHLLLIASLKDKFGEYGRIGLALVETREAAWVVKLLVMSCRVISRGVGTSLLARIMEMAKGAGAGLVAEFVPTPRNRMMYLAFKMAGFRECGSDGSVVRLEGNLSEIPKTPYYLKVASSHG